MKHSDPLRHLSRELLDLESAGLLRTRPAPLAVGEVSFCSNDYLGLAAAPGHAFPTGAADSGAGASRLVAGERPEHLALEREIAAYLGTEAALVFASGYAANVGLVSALAGPDDLILSDALNHASLIDGARLSRARVEVIPHLDIDALERALARAATGAPRSRQAWVVTESYFSMDADSPDLPRLRAVTEAFGAALLVDEAHALGVLGPNGRGLLAEAGVRAEAVSGTFGKAFGHGGAFVAGSHSLVAWLWNRARSFVFSTGLSPVVAAGARAAMDLARRRPELRERALAHAAHLRRRLAELAPQARVLGHGHVIPILVGDSRRAVEVAAAVRRVGIHAQAIRPPTVPDGTARLRLSCSARHTAEDVERAAVAVARAL